MQTPKNAAKASVFKIERNGLFMKNKKTVFFVGNAHLDPVWQWRWQEGSAAAKATVRSALDRMKEYPYFKFVCSSASVYKWIEDFDPEMFAEVKERVREGRFIVVGGWFVQPDCNIPAGEGFARQSLYSQRYFKEKLGVTAVTGYNVDSFGHNLMLPQILKKSGMKQYVFMRPGIHEKTMEKDIFRWRSPDGSEVLACRIPDPYCAYFDSMEKLTEMLQNNCERDKKYTDDGYMMFYGVGNHGGGPTKINIELIKEYAEGHPDENVVFSDVNDYFDMIREHAVDIPVHTDDLQHHASGCYSAVSRIKTEVRRSENALVAAEAYNVIAARLCKKAPATKSLAKAWENVLFTHFHDVMGGCCIKPAYDDAYIMLGEAESIAAKTENSALQTISWAIDTSDKKKGYPIVVFNPHSFEVSGSICINAQAGVITDNTGREITLQHVASRCCWRPADTLFNVTVPAMGYSTYYLKTDEELIKPVFEYRGEPKRTEESSVRAFEYGLENDLVRIIFDEKTGYIRSFFDKRLNAEILKGDGAVPTVIDESEHDTWSHAKNYFDKRIGKFGNARLTVKENGPLRAVIKVESFYNASRLTQYFTLYADKSGLEVRATVDWQEKHKMLKLVFDTAVTEAKAYYEIPFGVIERPADGEEECGQKWILARGENFGCAVINNNKYSFSVKGGEMALTALRSPIYADHGGKRTEESEYTDQGVSEFGYIFKAVGASEGYGSLVREARVFNTPLVNIIENNHDGYLPDSFAGVQCDCDNVTVSAIKFSEDGEGFVVRVYETDGRNTSFTLSGALLQAPLKADINGFGVNTYYIANGGKAWKEVLLTEYEP